MKLYRRAASLLQLGLPFVVLSMALSLSAPAFAEVQARTVEPQFTASEQEIIARNASLALVVTRDPWVVRRFLDELAQSEAEESPAPQAESAEPDPDLKRLERASPEAAHDLLQIIKQAGSDQGGMARGTGEPEGDQPSSEDAR